MRSGVLLALVAGILNGSFAAPTKYTARWKWENIWAVWAFVAFLVVPWTVALATVPHLFAAYHAVDAHTLLLLVSFGAGYGIAALCFGLGVASIGIALNFAIALGLSTAVGSLVPLFSLGGGDFSSPKTRVVLLGILFTLLGIAVCAAAGRAKERTLQQAGTGEDRPSFALGLLFAVLAGIGSPLLNFGLAFGGPLLKAAANEGASVSAQSNAVWPPVLTATLVPYFLYCTYLWRKNHSFGLFKAKGTGVFWLLGALMGVLWMGSISLFGSASSSMAEMGPILGWPLFMSSIILTSNVWGFATGEWRGASRSTLLVMVAGMAILILGFCILAYSARLV